MDRLDDRVARLSSLSPADREHLSKVIGEAALDLWSMGMDWPDLVERCLEVVEEEAAAGFVRIRTISPSA